MACIDGLQLLHMHILGFDSGAPPLRASLVVVVVVVVVASSYVNHWVEVLTY